MTTSLWEQIRELRAAGDDSVAGYDLRQQREAERFAEMPRLSCCPTAAVHVVALRDDSERDPAAKPVWVVHSAMPDDRRFQWAVELANKPGVTDDELRMARTFQPISFCPWCGTSVPDLRLKAVPPPHMCIEGDGYCGHCHERLGRFGSCMCSHPESAWEPVL